MLAINLIEQLMRTESHNSTVAYFFCQDSDERLNSLEALVKGLIFRLVREHKELGECIKHHWTTTSATSRSTFSNENQKTNQRTIMSFKKIIFIQYIGIQWLLSCSSLFLNDS